MSSQSEDRRGETDYGNESLHQLMMEYSRNDPVVRDVDILNTTHVHLSSTEVEVLKTKLMKTTAFNEVAQIQDDEDIEEEHEEDIFFI